MWRVPVPLIAGVSGAVTETFTADEYIGDLYAYLGSPTGIVTLNWTVDAADLGEIIIPNTFAPGSSFTFTLINGGRIVGEGGNGGVGGPDLGATGEAGSPGADGTAAIQADGHDVSVDCDDGFLLGGGGGGGGGAYNDTGTGGDAGGGGGGGQGWSGGSGGAGGNPSFGLPPPDDGTAGTRMAPGAGGDGGGTSDVASRGGTGGAWGSGGALGASTEMLSTTGVMFYYGGAGGQAGAAFEGSGGAEITFTGAKNEATLRSENRVKGETGEPYVNMLQLNIASMVVTPMATETVGWEFERDGNLVRINTESGDTTYTDRWTNGTGPAAHGDDYEIREIEHDGDPWTTTGAGVGTWVALSATREWSITETAPSARETAAGSFEIRRADAAGADERLMTFYLSATWND